LLTNLIKNSIEASPEGVAIEISGRSEGDKILLKVRDDGPGFPVEKLDRIEQPYFTTKGSGTGLGLAISKKIVEEHGGMIRFYNDKGAVAEIILPVN
jgi:signal transduction histidine kinase